MTKAKTTIYEPEFPDILEVTCFLASNQPKNYAPREYCYIDVYLDEDQEAIGSSKCSKCKNTIDIFSKFCNHCGAKVRERRYLRKKKERVDETSENSTIRI